MQTFWKEILTFCQSTTTRVGDRLKEDFGKLSAERKADGTLVTSADHWADQQLKTAISSQFPQHGLLTEETIHIFPPNDWCWIVDPIDGTTNFTRGIPIWGISLGLLYQGTPVFGFVYFPHLEQYFYGYWYGNSGLSGPVGAYRNGEPIHTSTDEPNSNHLFSLCTRSTHLLKNPFPCKIRLMGVASYNILLVASGVALGGVEATPKIWDLAAVWAILQGAGGVFLSLSPEDLFPLQVGQNYGQKSLPCLVLSRPELIPIFQPLVEPQKGS